MANSSKRIAPKRDRAKPASSKAEQFFVVKEDGSVVGQLSFDGTIKETQKNAKPYITLRQVGNEPMVTVDGRGWSYAGVNLYPVR